MVNVEDAVWVALAVWIAALWLGTWIENDRWEHLTIKRNLAHYDSKTGKWTWNAET